MTTMTEPTTHTLEAPGATLTYDSAGPTRLPRRCSSSARRWAPAGSGRSPATSPIARS